MVLTARNLSSLTLAAAPPVTVRLCVVPHNGDSLEAPQAVRDHLRRRAQAFVCPLCQGLLGELELGQAHQQRVARRARLHGSNKKHLVLGTASDLASGQLATQVGVVDLHAPVELAGRKRPAVAY